MDKNISINVGGNVSGAVSIGDHNVIYKSEAESSKFIDDLTVFFQQMNDRYSSASIHQKQTLLAMELQKMIKQQPSLRDRLLNAIQAGGSELLSVLVENPFVSVSIETLKGWLEADPSS